MLIICAQSGRVSGLEKKTDPASSARSEKKRLKENNNRLLGIGNKVCIPFGTKSRILICGWLDYTALLFIQPIFKLLCRFSVKNTLSRPVLRVKIAIF